MKRKKRIERIENNLNEISIHDSNIASAMIKYDKYIEAERNYKLALHADNVALYKDKKIRKKLIKKGSEYCYPQEALEMVKEISNREHFEASSISEGEILKLQQLELFIENREHINDGYVEKNIVNKLLLDGGIGGGENVT